MTKHGNSRGIPLPAGWSQHARSATLHVISLAQFALAYTRGWAVNSRVTRVRLKAKTIVLGSKSHGSSRNSALRMPE